MTDTDATATTAGRSRRSSSSPRSPCRPSCWPSCSSARSADVERWCHELAAGYEADGRGFQLVRVAGGYRLQTHPDLTPYVERFLLHDQRARLSARRAGDAGDRRLQAADLAGPDRLDPRRRPRRRAADAAGPRLHRRRRPRPRARPGGAVRHDDRRSSRSSASTASTTSRRSPSSSPVPTWSRPSRPGCGSPMPDPRRLSSGRASRRGSGCRRCWPPAATAAGGCARTLIAAGRVTVNGEVAVLGRRVDPDVDLVEVDGAPVGTKPGLVHYLLNKPAGRRDDGEGHPRPPDGRRAGAGRAAGVPRRPARRRHRGPAAADERRRAGQPHRPSPPRPRQGVPGDGRRRAGQPGGAAPAARRRRARRRPDGAGQGVPAEPRRAADHDPRGPQPPGPADVRGRRPPREPPRAHPHRPAARPPPAAGRLAHARPRRGPRPAPQRRPDALATASVRPVRSLGTTRERRSIAGRRWPRQRDRPRADRRVDRPRPARGRLARHAATTSRPAAPTRRRPRVRRRHRARSDARRSRSSPSPCSPSPTR